MTAMNVFLQGRCGYILTDTAWFHDDGIVASFAPKVILFPKLRLAVTMRGGGPEMHAVLARARPRSAVDLIQRLPALIADGIEKSLKIYAGETAASLGATVAVVHYCRDRRRAFAHVMASDARYTPPGYVPYTVQSVLHVLAPGLDEPGEVGGLSCALGRDVTLTDPASFNPAVDGLAILEAQRASTADMYGLPPAHRVGGQAHLTTVTPTGVRTRVLWEWPDRIGEKVAA